ncbi:MAG: hypothetical protein ACE5EC_10580, partial [Phycisphaerae bacterium]
MPDIRIKRALIAVYDKTGVADFARALVEEFGIELISTGGTARHLREAGLPVTLVEEITGFPEMLDGRVKTLHPKIHAAILADRDNPDHMHQLAEHGIQPIDMVVVSLYPFEKTVAQPDCTLEEAIEMIDIGGPCLLRAAAKNHKHVLGVISKRSYKWVIESLRGEDPGRAVGAMARWEANTVFRALSNYNRHIGQFLGWHLAAEGSDPTDPTLMSQEEIDAWRHPMFLSSVSAPSPMRYGENPHQRSQFFSEHTGREDLLDSAIDGRYDADKAFSFNNAVDADAALNLCSELTRASVHIRNKSETSATGRGTPVSVCFIKHTNACGAGVAEDPIEAYRLAYLGDPNAAMGGILAVNHSVDAGFAEVVMNSLGRWGKAAGAGAFFVEVWLAPQFDEAAVEVIRTAKKWGQRVRLLTVGDMNQPPAEDEFDFKHIAGGMLAQIRDTVGLNEDQWKIVTERASGGATVFDHC